MGWASNVTIGFDVRRIATDRTYLLISLLMGCATAQAVGKLSPRRTVQSSGSADLFLLSHLFFV
jgi:hypothetical protein